MTDEQIIKALECCSQETADCKNCPNEDTCGEIDVIEQTVSLIKRQQAEIKRLEFDNVHWNDWEVKCRAINEFAERLKEQFSENKYILPSVNISVDNLVKEMTEQ